MDGWTDGRKEEEGEEEERLSSVVVQQGCHVTEFQRPGGSRMEEK